MYFPTHLTYLSFSNLICFYLKALSEEQGLNTPENILGEK